NAGLMDIGLRLTISCQRPIQRKTEMRPNSMNVASMMDPTDTTLHQVERREALARKILEEIHTENISEPRVGPTFTPAQAAELIHRSPSAIRMAELDGRLPEQKRTEAGRREGYTLEQLDH